MTTKYELTEVTLEDAMTICGSLDADEIRDWEKGHGREKVQFTDHYRGGELVFRVAAPCYGDARYYRVTPIR